MIALPESSIPARPAAVVGGLALFAHLDEIRAEAAEAVEYAFDGISTKKIASAGVPGCSRQAVGRAINGAETNPVYRIALFLIVLRRLGVSRPRARQGWERMKAVGDRLFERLWPEEDPLPLRDALDADAEEDVQDDLPRLRASNGCVDSARELVRKKERQIVRARITIMSVERWLTTR